MHRKEPTLAMMKAASIDFVARDQILVGAAIGWFGEETPYALLHLDGGYSGRAHLLPTSAQPCEVVQLSPAKFLPVNTVAWQPSIW